MWLNLSGHCSVVMKNWDPLYGTQVNIHNRAEIDRGDGDDVSGNTGFLRRHCGKHFFQNFLFYL